MTALILINDKCHDVEKERGKGQPTAGHGTVTKVTEMILLVFHTPLRHGFQYGRETFAI